MISSENYKAVHIHIKTYKGNLQKVDKHSVRMNEDRRHSKLTTNKFICSICLNSNKFNTNPEVDQKVSKILSGLKSREFCSEKSKVRIKDDSENKVYFKKRNTENKAVQTLHTDLNKSLNLLNEVLTVFRNKKQIEAKGKSKSVVLKDAKISTDDIRHILKSRLSVSKVCQFSINDEIYDRNDKFIIITSHDDIIGSQSMMDLSKHKSSSIPQMKVEELKHSLKEKTTTKDAIEEVNRMFATVRRRKRDITEDSNRPSVRNGPRVLPVVKTKHPANYETSESVDKILPVCKCCQDCFSSGDSLVNPEFCQNKQNQTGKPDKCIYMMCCHYKNYRKMMCCERCKERDFRCNHNRDRNFEGND